MANQFRWPAEPSVRVADGDLQLDAHVWLDRALYQGLYERTELELVSRLVRPGEACVDVGANVGVYSVLFAARSRGGSVVAFEPSPTFQRLQMNLRRYPNATALNLGLSDRPGRLHLARAGADDIGASFRDGTKGDPEVPVARLDEVPQVRALGRIDFLKIDVEGWESAVMAGASRLWQGRMIGVALIEANPQWGPVGYLTDVEALGYHCFEVREQLRFAGLRFGLDLRPLNLGKLRTQVNILVARPDMLARLTATGCSIPRR